MDFLIEIYNYRVVAQYLDTFARGLGATLWISFVCLIFSLLLGTVVAILRMSRRAILWRPTAAYIQFVRATPLLIQIYLVYYGLPMLMGGTAVFDEMNSGIIALSLHTAPYMGEIIRAGIESVGRGQREAALAVGMNFTQRMVHVVLPQAFANVTPTLLGQTAVLIKDTSLLSIIAVFEVMSAGLLLMSERIMPNEAFVTAAICYLAIYAGMLVISRIAQRRLGGTAWRP